MADFDKILKENIEAVFLPVIEEMLGISIKEIFEIKDKIQRTIEREFDFLKIIIDQNGKKWILHLEFQTTNDPKMIYRMAEYRAILLQRSPSDRKNMNFWYVRWWSTWVQKNPGCELNF